MSICIFYLAHQFLRAQRYEADPKVYLNKKKIETCATNKGALMTGETNPCVSPIAVFSNGTCIYEMSS